MIIGVLAMALAAFFFSEVVGYSVHRLAHWPKSGWLFRSHLRHHAHAYPPGRYKTEKYLGDIRTSFFPVFVGIFVICNVLTFTLLSWPLFLTFFTVTSAVSIANSIFHDSFHVHGHWLTRFDWHGRLTAVHQAHHENVKKNMGIYWYGLDRMLGSFREPSEKRRNV